MKNVMGPLKNDRDSMALVVSALLKRAGSELDEELTTDDRAVVNVSRLDGKGYPVSIVRHEVDEHHLSSFKSDLVEGTDFVLFSKVALADITINPDQTFSFKNR